MAVRGKGEEGVHLVNEMVLFFFLKTKMQHSNLFVVFSLQLLLFVLFAAAFFVVAHDNHDHEHQEDIEPPPPDPGLIHHHHSSSPYAVPHHCVHDSHIVPQMRKEEAEFAARGETRPEARFAHPDGREAKTLAIGNMRWVIRTTDLYDIQKIVCWTN